MCRLAIMTFVPLLFEQTAYVFISTNVVVHVQNDQKKKHQGTAEIEILFRTYEGILVGNCTLAGVMF